MSTPYRQSLDEALAALSTDGDRGLSEDEARLRLERNGPNELTAEKPPRPRRPGERVGTDVRYRRAPRGILLIRLHNRFYQKRRLTVTLQEKTKMAAPEPRADQHAGTPWHAVERQKVLGVVQADAVHGLDTAKAKDLLGVHGPNILVQEKQEPWWEEALESLTEPLQLLLIAVAAVYFWLGEREDAFTILGVILAVAGIATLRSWHTTSPGRSPGRGNRAGSYARRALRGNRGWADRLTRRQLLRSARSPTRTLHVVIYR